MLLIDERLVVFATQYSYSCYGPVFEDEMPSDSSTISNPVSESTYPIVDNNGSTKVHVYNTANMELLSTHDLTGSYISARSINNAVYVVTSAWMNLYEYTQYFDPYNQEIYGRGFDEDTYRAAAQAEAMNRAGDFVAKLTSELDCSTIQPIALLQNEATDLAFSGVMESLVSVHFFDVTDVTGTLDSRKMMLPSSNWNVYASLGYLVLAGEGYNIETLIADEGTSQSASESTYIICYELDGPSIADVKVGSVQGYALNQFSIDQHTQMDPVSETFKDFLRIATCTRRRWGFGWGREAWEPSDETLCQVNVLDISANMTVVGTVDDLGKPGERIYSVRFQEDRGYVVTFVETDPFYTLDLSDVTDPRAVGELEIPGYSNYLHPIGDDLILGVGQAVENGMTTGLQISLFDVSDFTKPARLFNFIEADGSYSEAQYDHRGFRYLNESGLLILPLTIYGNWDQNDGLDGFRLYSVDETAGIQAYLTVEHGAGDFYRTGCWSTSGYLSPRSIVKDGGLRTFKGHAIVGYNLSDRTPVNTVDLDANLPRQECTPYYFEGV